ncbi:MAG TPA: biotin/lipoyl-binding protein, partial [Hyphomicrobiaceae bacterium]|nr:biotin/lipoyl-binding protein [Hyphomicrobiaceae bacterium]
MPALSFFKYGVAAAAFLVASLPASAADPAATPPPVTVSIITTEKQDLPILEELPGRIAPMRIAEVRPRVSGIVIERVFTQGSLVKEGEVLYRIDPEPFKVQVESAKA